MRPTVLLPFYISVYSAVVSCIYFLLPLYLKGNLHFTGGQIGLLYAVLSLNAILVSFPVGVIGDRYPARILTRVGLAATAASLWGLALVGSFWAFLAVFWGFGLSIQLFRLSLDTLLFKEDQGHAPRRLGQYNAMRMGGMLVGVLLGGAVYYWLDFTITLKLFSLGVLLLIAPTVRLPVTRGVRTALFDYGRDFLAAPVLFFVTWLFLFTLHWGAEATSLSLFLEHNLGLSPLGVGLYMAGEFAVVALTAYLYGRFWAGRLKPLTFLALALVVFRHRPYLHDLSGPALVLCLAGGARVRGRPHPHGDLHHHHPALSRGPHRRQRQPHFAHHHHGGLCRFPDLRPPGRGLRLPGAADRLRGHQPGSLAAGLCRFAGVMRLPVFAKIENSLPLDGGGLGWG